MTRRQKLFGTCLGSSVLVLMVMILVYWAIVTGRANDLIRQYVADEVSLQMGVPCQIARIEGNPFGRYRIIGVQIGNLVSVDTIGVRYKPALAFRVTLDSLFVKGIRVQMPPPSDGPPPDLSHLRTLVPFQINHVAIDRGQVALDAQNQLSNLLFRGSVSAVGDRFTLAVSQYQSVQFTPPLTLTNLEGVGILDGGEIVVEDVGISLPNTQVFLTGKVGRLDDLALDLTFRASPLTLADLETFLGPMPPKLSLFLDGAIQGHLGNLTSRVSAQFDSSSIIVDLSGSIFPRRLEAGVLAQLRGYDPSVFFELEQRVHLDGDITGKVNLDTLGVQEAQIQAAFSTVFVDDIHQGETSVEWVYKDNLVEVDLATIGNLGQVGVQGSYHLETEHGHAEIDLVALKTHLLPQAPSSMGEVTGKINVQKDTLWHGDVSLAKVTWDSTDIEDLQVHMRYDNSGLSLETFQLKLPDLATHISGLAQVDLGSPTQRSLVRLTGKTDLHRALSDTTLGDTLHFESDLDLHLGEYVTGQAAATAQLTNFRGGVDSMRVVGQLDSAQNIKLQGDLWGSVGRVGIDGIVNKAGGLGLDFWGGIDDLAQLANLAGYRAEGDSLRINGQVTGALDAPLVAFDASIPNVVVEGIPIEKLSVSGNWAFPDTGAISLRVGALSWGTRRLNTIYLDATHKGEKTDFLFGSNAQDEDRVYLWGQVHLQDRSVSIVADSLHLQAAQVALYNKGPLRVDYDFDRGFHVGHFELVGPAGQIVARDHPNLKAAIEVQLVDIDLRPWAFLLGQPQIGGVLNADLAFSGDLDDPLVFAEGQIRDVGLYGLQVPQITTNMSFGDARLVLDVKVLPTVGKPISVSGSVPVDPTEGVQLTVRSEGVALALVDTFVSGMNAIDGDLVVRLDVGGTVVSPTFSGRLQLSQGRIDHAAIGRVYEPIFCAVSLNHNRLQLDSLSIGTGGQQLSVSGFAEWVDGAIANFDARANFARYQPIRWPEVKAELSGGLHLNGTPDKPRLTGNLVVQQADIRLGELMATPSTGWEQWPFVQALQMAMSVRIDQQVWVRDPTFNIEMVGDLDVVKDLDGFKIFGNMQSRRGNYVFQNRRLDITRGDILFQGKTIIDPNLDIEAQTRVMARLGSAQSGVQGAGNKPVPVTIVVAVGGVLSQPEVKLSSDPPVGQFDDILSVLLVGATPDVVAVSNASDFVLGALANRFGQRLGQDLHLDLVEVDVAESNISRVRVGKYLTPRLFVSYAQDMSSTGREVAVEFKLLPNLTLEAKQIDAGQEEQLTNQTRESIGIVWEREW